MLPALMFDRVGSKYKAGQPKQSWLRRGPVAPAIRPTHPASGHGLVRAVAADAALAAFNPAAPPADSTAPAITAGWLAGARGNR